MIFGPKTTNLGIVNGVPNRMQKWTEGDLNPRHPRCERGITTPRLPALLLSRLVSAFIHLLKE